MPLAPFRAATSVDYILVCPDCLVDASRTYPREEAVPYYDGCVIVDLTYYGRERCEWKGHVAKEVR